VSKLENLLAHAQEANSDAVIRLAVLESPFDAEVRTAVPAELTLLLNKND
jgi:hypothetical protein